MAETFADVEQVIRWVFTLDRDTLEVVRREVDTAVARAEGTHTAAVAAGEAARRQVRKESIDQAFASYSDEVQKELQLLQGRVDHERQALREMHGHIATLRREGYWEEDAAYQKRLKEIQAQGAAVEAAEDSVRRKLAESTSAILEQAKAMREVGEAAGLAPEAVEAMMTPEMRQAERQGTPLTPMQREQKERQDEAAKARQAELDAERRRLQLRSGIDEEEGVRQARRQTFGGQMFSMAQSTATQMAGPGAGLVGIGGAFAGVMMGLTNPISMLVEIARGIKDLVMAGIADARKSAQAQAAMVGGSPELAHRAIMQVTQGEGAAQAAYNRSIATENRIRGGLDLTAEESEQVPEAMNRMRRAAPGVSFQDSDEGKRIFAQVVTLHRQTGMDLKEVAGLIGEVARRQGRPDEAGAQEASQQLDWVVRAATTLADQFGKVDSSILIKNITDLSKQFLPFGATIDDATRLATRFGEALETGRIKSENLFEAMFRARNQPMGVRALEAQMLVEGGREKATTDLGKGGGELFDILERLKAHPHLQGTTLAALAGGQKSAEAVVRQAQPGMAEDDVKRMAADLSGAVRRLGEVAGDRIGARTGLGVQGDPLVRAMGQRYLDLETQLGQQLRPEFKGVQDEGVREELRRGVEAPSEDLERIQPILRATGTAFKEVTDQLGQAKRQLEWFPNMGDAVRGFTAATHEASAGLRDLYHRAKRGVGLSEEGTPLQPLPPSPPPAPPAPPPAALTPAPPASAGPQAVTVHNTGQVGVNISGSTNLTPESVRAVAEEVMSRMPSGQSFAEGLISSSPVQNQTRQANTERAANTGGR